MSSQQSALPTTRKATLRGRWKFQLREQTVRLPSGEILEVIRQEPPQAAERFLDITDHELVTTFEYDPEDAEALGRRYYETTRAYFREGDSLFITLLLTIPIPGLAPMLQLIQQLDDHQLILSSVSTTAPGWPATEVVTHYRR